MPPKKKREAVLTKETAAVKSISKLEDEENENKSKLKPKVASKIQKNNQASSESEPENEKPKKIAKNTKTKKTAEGIEIKSKGRKRTKVDADESNDEFEEKRPSRGRAKMEENIDEPQASNTDSENEKPKKRAKTSKTKKVAKGRKKAKADSDESDEFEEKSKPSRGAKIKEIDEEPTKPLKGRKAAAPVKNKTSTSYSEIDFNNCTRKSDTGKEWKFKISNWNVDGIRAWLKKGGLDYLQYEKPDVFCLQETKCPLDKLPPEVKEVDGYKVFWHCSTKDGYAGVALYSKIDPISVQYGLDDEEHDEEGRMITAEYEKFYVISVYVPNAGRGLVTLPKRLKWNDVFRNFVAELDKKKPVIVCGDMNVAHLEIDLANPKTNTKNAGFTKEERDGMTDFLSDGYVDTFRELYPDKTQAYTFWTYMANCRAKNVGWRLDYFITSNRLKDSICDNIIRSEVYGSDHCPITLFLNV